MTDIFQECDRLRKAYAEDAVRKGFDPRGAYASSMYQIAIEVFIKLMADGKAPSFEEHVQWYLNQIEENTDARD